MKVPNLAAYFRRMLLLMYGAGPWVKTSQDPFAQPGCFRHRGFMAEREQHDLLSPAQHQLGRVIDLFQR